MTDQPTTRAIDFIGRGWSFPIRVDSRGGIALTSGAEEITASLRMILSTALGERVMRPEFGCAIWDHIFDPITPSTLGAMTNAVREAVTRWEPRVELESVDAEPNPENPGQVDIDIVYTIPATNDRRNLVFPFYVIPAEEATP